MLWPGAIRFLYETGSTATACCSSLGVGLDIYTIFGPVVDDDVEFEGAGHLASGSAHHIDAWEAKPAALQPPLTLTLHGLA